MSRGSGETTVMAFSITRDARKEEHNHDVVKAQIYGGNLSHDNVKLTCESEQDRSYMNYLDT
jgi:hypothetical protein